MTEFASFVLFMCDGDPVPLVDFISNPEKSKMLKAILEEVETYTGFETEK